MEAYQRVRQPQDRRVRRIAGCGAAPQAQASGLYGAHLSPVHTLAAT